MNFLFRVDAGDKVGLGHFYRSINLANKLTKNAHNVIFLHFKSKFWDSQNSVNFRYKHFNFENDNQQIELLKQFKIDVFYVDGIIDFSEKIISKIKDLSRVVFFQNIGNSRHLADVFILPSIHQKEEFFRNFDQSTSVYKGLKYFTFSEDIQKFNKKAKPEFIKSIGITAGGSDPNNTLIQLYQMIDFSLFSKIDFTFYYGKDYLYPDEIPVPINKNVRWELFKLKDIYESDLLISAFGVSTYEFLALSMPIISFGHQETNAIASNVLAEQTGAIKSLGQINEIKKRKLNQTIKQLIDCKQDRDAMIDLASKIVDLKGIDRVVNLLEEIRTK